MPRDAPVARDRQLERPAERRPVQHADHRDRAMRRSRGPPGPVAARPPAGTPAARRRPGRPGPGRRRSDGRRRPPAARRGPRPRGGPPVGSPGRRGSPRRGRSRAPRWRSAPPARRPPRTPGAGRRARRIQLASVLVMGAGAVGSYYGALLARDGHDVTLVARGPHLAALGAAGPDRGARGRRRPLGRAGGRGRRAGGAPTRSRHRRDQVAPHPSGGRGPRPMAPPRRHGPLAAERGGERRPPRGGCSGPTGCSAASPSWACGWRSRAWSTTRRRAGCGWATRPASRPRARAAYELLAPSWDVELAEDIVQAQWHKLLWNAGFNAICAVTGATAGEALATPGSEALVRQAMWEVVAVAARHGVTLTEAEVDEMAAPNPELRDYHPSTARDLAAGKPLERDALCGFLAREGARARRPHAGQRRARRPAGPPGGPFRRRQGLPRTP